jgi:hypothetical protein
VAENGSKEVFDIITLTNTLMYPIAFKVWPPPPQWWNCKEMRLYEFLQFQFTTITWRQPCVVIICSMQVCLS